MRRHAVLVFAGLLGVAACLFPSLGGLTGTVIVSDAGTDGSDASDTDACPGTAGPTMVRVAVPPSGSYCVDRTEVTNADYAQFLANVATLDRNTLPAVCATHGPFVPVGTDGGPTFPYTSGLDADPVGNVDWCEAAAFCIWAGKRLCGHIGGGTNPMSDAVNSSASQWFNACSLNGTLFYPYGDAYDASTCNSRDRTPNLTLVPVGSLPGCQGGYPGLFDMAGNVEELEDSCDDAGACLSRGGSYVDDPGDSQTRCDSVTEIVPFGEHSGDIGFRCCGP